MLQFHFCFIFVKAKTCTWIRNWSNSVSDLWLNCGMTHKKAYIIFKRYWSLIFFRPAAVGEKWKIRHTICLIFEYYSSSLLKVYTFSMNLDMMENTKKEIILMIAFQSVSRTCLPLYRMFSHSSEKIKG